MHLLIATQIMFGIGAALRVVACACMMLLERQKQK
jgi:hypothetical protein